MLRSLVGSEMCIRDRFEYDLSKQTIIEFKKRSELLINSNYHDSSWSFSSHVHILPETYLHFEIRFPPNISKLESSLISYFKAERLYKAVPISQKKNFNFFSAPQGFKNKKKIKMKISG